MKRAELPKKIKVLSGTYEIVPAPRKEAAAKNAAGWFSYKTGKIYIALNGYSNKSIADTLLHEIVHVWWLEMGWTCGIQEEPLAMSLPMMMITLFRDNPDLYQWLMEKYDA
jgi:hypothetical protein